MNCCFHKNAKICCLTEIEQKIIKIVILTISTNFGGSIQDSIKYFHQDRNLSLSLSRFLSKLCYDIFNIVSLPLNNRF